jgi:hypothetical protein
MIIMSADGEANEKMMCCASCGQAEVDDIKLETCDGCDLVKYCSEWCLELHREQHYEECKKRKAELRDRDLFTMPEASCYGECPICCLPLPIDTNKSTMAACCSKRICLGCNFANQMREHDQGLEHKCAFCREPMAETEEECDKNIMKRIKKNCPAAMRKMAYKCYEKGDYETAVEYWTKAAELGDTEAHYNLSVMYRKAQGVEKDMEKQVYHLEQAAIAGHPTARHNLGIEEWNHNFERAKKHFTIAANLGYNDSLKLLRKLYADGHASKEDYAAALRAYQAAVDATKSAERKVAEAYYAQNRG